MIKSQHKRTAAASMFQNGISRNIKCAVKDGFHRDSHIYKYIYIYIFLSQCVGRSKDPTGVEISYNREDN